MATAPYDNLTTILNSARVRLNDAISTSSAVSGLILNTTQVFTQQAVNSAWRKLQSELSALGFLRFRQESIVLTVPPAASNDPGIQCSLSWSGYFNGATTALTPVLPQDLVRPVWAWERPSGTTKTFRDTDLILSGLPSVLKKDWIQMWEWRADTFVFPGALTTVDLRIRYDAFLADFANVGTTPWFAASVPILRCLDAFSNYICAEICSSRQDGEQDVLRFTSLAESAAKVLAGYDVREQKSVDKVSEYGKMADQFTPGSDS